MTLFRAAVLFFGGGIFVTMGDKVHVKFGVLSQNDQSFFGQAWWVWPVFGVMCVGLLPGYAIVRGLFRKPPTQKSLGGLLSSALVFFAAYAITGPYAHETLLLSVALPLAWIPRVAARRRTEAVVFSLILAVMGPVTESVFSLLGFFAYAEPDILGVPFWLPGIYLHGGLLATEVDAWWGAGAGNREAQPDAEGG